MNTEKEKKEEKTEKEKTVDSLKRLGFTFNGQLDFDTVYHEEINRIKWCINTAAKLALLVKGDVTVLANTFYDIADSLDISGLFLEIVQDPLFVAEASLDLNKGLVQQNRINKKHNKIEKMCKA